MQKGIIIRDGADVLEKREYAGELSAAETEYARLLEKFPQYQFQLFQDTTDPAFSSVVVTRFSRIER